MSIHEFTKIEKLIFIHISFVKDSSEFLPCLFSTLASLSCGIELGSLCENFWAPCQNLIYIALDEGVEFCLDLRCEKFFGFLFFLDLAWGFLETE